jgi:hypothetical protein
VTALRRITLALAIAASACATPVATASPTVSAPATAAASSPQPTPVATKAPPWTELRWSAPVPIPDQGSIFQVLSWHDGYVAAGQTTDGGQYVGGLFASPDGLQWQRTAIVPLGPTLVLTTTRVVAVVTTGRDNAAPKVQSWASSDGRTWQPQDALTIVGATVDHLTARGSTIVGMGTDSSGRVVMWRSIDGAAWTPGDLPSAHAIVRNIFAVADGFIALGREGEPDIASGGVGVRGVGLPAAWWSADGRAWTALQVEGKPAAGAQLIQLFGVADGYFAVGSDTTDPSLNARTALIWTSSDARVWRLLGPPPYTGPAGANGERAVYFASGARSIEAHVTQDGRQWAPLPFAGDLADIPNLPGFAQGAQLDQVFVMSHGIIVTGQLNGRLVAWFADAEPR